MLSLSKRRILRSALRFKYSGLHGATCWLKDQNLAALGEFVVDVVRGIISKVAGPDIEMLKSAKRKIVFRVKHPENSQETFVAKVFFLNHFSHRLSYHLYGLDEAANSVRARDRGINTPEVYGYSDIRDRLGFVKTSIIILEDLRHMSTIGKLMSTMSEAECTKIFMSTIPLFISLYRANCNHININSNAVMLGGDNTNSALFLLDFQHAKFYDKPSLNILMFEAGHFAWSCRQWISTETALEWADRIVSYVGIKNPDEQNKTRETFEYYYRGKGRTPTQTALSRKQRKRIF